MHACLPSAISIVVSKNSFLIMRLFLNTSSIANKPISISSHSIHSCCSETSVTRTTSLKLGKRWAEYQGINNWSGLLDPVDPVLRSEILRYGEFVQAAYKSFNCDLSSPYYATCRYKKQFMLSECGLQSSGYRVTKHIHASSGSKLPKWVTKFADSFSSNESNNNGSSWMLRTSSWIGYVAVCNDEKEIARLGRRDIVIAYRGTLTFMEWFENLRATLTHLPTNVSSVDSSSNPMVEKGFWSLFTSSSACYSNLRDQVRDEIRRLIDIYGCSNDHPISLTITGHSLGAALAILTAYDITSNFKNPPLVTVISFGCPRVGNSVFQRKLEDQGGKVLRIVNTQDIVTKVPGFVINEGLPRWLLSKTGWDYADIGKELRLSGQRTANVVSCHDLGVYLNLVKQLSASCPIRAKVKEGFRWPFFAQSPLQ